MIDLLEISDQYVQNVSTEFTRYLMGEINWNNRLIGIKGARGTGKTTMLLQYLNRKQLPASKAAYFSLDEIYFTANSVVDTIREFYQKGGQIAALDEVHKYPGWSREVKIIYDRYPELQIIYTGSSIIDISLQNTELSRRSILYELPGLSYREYLQLTGMLEMEAIPLQNILSDAENIRKRFPAGFRPLEKFNDYLKRGYYPFFMEDEPGYHARLKQLIRLIIESDMAEVKGFDIRNAKKLLQLIYIISQQVPFKPNLVKLSDKSGIHRNSISNYLYFMEEARLINMLYPSGVSIATLQKPEKIYLNNTNLMYALSEESPEKGNIRESFFLNQLAVQHIVRLPKAVDFEIDGKYLFEVGGSSKGRKQIKNPDNAYLVKDDMEYPAGQAMPLWLFGFIY